MITLQAQWKCIKNAEDLNLEHSLLSGQAFRWKKEGNAFFGWIRNEPVALRQEGGSLFFMAQEPDAARGAVAEYLDLGTSLELVLQEIDRDPPIHLAVQKLRGLRILRQDPWETLAGFLLSSNNNIPRVQKMVESLCERFGEAAEWEGGTVHRFPSAKALASLGEKDMAACRLGYRAAPLLESARRVARGVFDWEELRQMDYAEAKKILLDLPGVGEKVADCILLFSLDKLEAFPVDVWIKRVVEDFYFRGKRLTPKRVRRFAQEHFGRYAGVAQQYLFHYARLFRSSNPEKPS